MTPLIWTLTNLLINVSDLIIAHSECTVRKRVDIYIFTFGSQFAIPARDNRGPERYRGPLLPQSH